MSHLDCNNIIIDAQHDFRQKHSANLQLLQTVHDLALCLKKGQTDCILLNFSKAFDKVSHCECHLLKYYLTNCTQQVVCDGSISESADVTSGVPQGSVLGPMLFLLFVNDLPVYVNSTCRLFADDCLLYWGVNTPNDAAILQQDLHNLEQWAEKWFVKFNPTKCVILTVTNKTCSIHSQHVSEAKYLGLTLDANLNFNKHIDNICKKVNAILGFIRRNTHYCQHYVKVDAYNT